MELNDLAAGEEDLVEPSDITGKRAAHLGEGKLIPNPCCLEEVTHAEKTSGDKLDK